MSLRRFGRVAWLEWNFNIRRVVTFLWIALLVLFAWAFSTGSVSIGAGDSQVGGKKAFFTSQFAVAQQVSLLSLLAYGFFIAVVSGMSPVRDAELRVGEILHATPLRPREYVWGKFLACILTFLGIMAIHLGAMVVFNHLFRGGGAAAEGRGPLVLANYLVPMVVFLLPMTLFLAGVTFAIGQVTRSPILVFVLPVGLLMACGFFLWTWSPGWLDPRYNRALMYLDPTGYRWLHETWLKVDRGVAFYNTEPIPFDPAFLGTRLVYAALGLLSVGWASRSLARSLRGERVSRSVIEECRDRVGRPVEMPPNAAGIPKPGTLAPLRMSSSRPGWARTFWAVARAELRELRSSAGLYLFIPLIVLQTIANSTLALGPFDTPLLSTPGSLAAGAMGPLTVMVCLLLLFYTVESVLRESHVRLDPIAHATPTPALAVLLGKLVAASFVGASVLLATMAVGAFVLFQQGTVKFDIGPYLLLWGLLLLPTLVVWTSFVAALVALTRNRYATYGIGLAVLTYSGYRFLTGEMNWLGNWPLWSAVNWSDISKLELDRPALILNRVWVLLLAGVFAALTVLWFTRRDRDAAGVFNRLRPRKLLRRMLELSPVLIPAIAVGFYLNSRIDRGPEGETGKKRAKDYWVQNLATWNDHPLPTLTHVELDLHLDPDQSSFRVKGEYTLENRTEKLLRDVPITAGLNWEGLSAAEGGSATDGDVPASAGTAPGEIAWTWNGEPAHPADRTHLFVFSPEQGLERGESVRLGFSYKGRLPVGISKNGGGASEFILPSGVVLSSFGPTFVPTVGFVDSIGVEKENKYEARRYPDNFYEGRTDPAFGTSANMTTHLKISAPERFTINSVGVLESNEVSDGRRTVVWRSDEPVHFFNVVAGEWAVKKGEYTSIYYHPAHWYNVDAMSEALDAARSNYSDWFYPFPWKELKISEFPNLASYAQGFPTNITFSEGIGFLTNANQQADAPFLVTAHESAHQWWGNLVLPGKGPGGNVLSEGLAHFSTAMLIGHVKGDYSRMEFLKQLERTYTERRNVDEERPLVHTDGSLPTDGTVTYDRGGWVFWMMMQHLGRDAMLGGLHDFIDQYRVTDDFPVLQDFLAVMRKRAAKPDAFDAFADQWVRGKDLPEFQLSEPVKSRSSDLWISTARLKNVGTGRVRVSVAAERGQRFDSEGHALADFQSQQIEVEIDPAESKIITLEAPFEPERLVVDPDVHVLQLFRGQAKIDL